MKILVTGFEAFGEESINPSSEVLEQLPDEILGAKLIKLEIPTALGRSVALLEDIIAKEMPDVVLNIGQAGGRDKSEINIERIAINISDYNIADNDGNMLQDERIIDEADDAYFLTLPIRDILNTLKENNIPSCISNTAGTYICNYVAFCMAHLTRTTHPKMKSGFIHIPFLPQQVINKPKIPSMSLDMMVQAIRLALEVIIKQSQQKMD